MSMSKGRRGRKKGKKNYRLAGVDEPLTKSVYYLLSLLRMKAKGEYVYRVDIKQSQLAEELKISRQALSVKLRPLIQKGYIRTGRGFIELTEKGLNFMGYYAKPVYVMVSVEPIKRREIYHTLKEKGFGRLTRVAGDVDLIIEADGTKAAEILEYLSTLDGIKSTKTYFALEEI